MAHQTDVYQVKQSFESEASTHMVQDPVCGMKFPKKEARSVLFKGDETVYFCSRTCKEKYMALQKKPKQAA